MSFDIEELKKNFNSDHIEVKSWGLKYCLLYGSNYCVDILYINKGGYSSWHLHNTKKNKFICMDGALQLHIKRDVNEIAHWITLEKDEVYTINEKVLHKFEAVEDSVIVEVSYTYCDPKDIIRLDTGGIKGNV